MKFTPTPLRLTAAIFALCCCVTASGEPPKVRVTTWNLEWFPNGSPKELPLDAQNARITAAAGVLRQLDPDILLLQEMKDYDACARLAEAIRPGTYQIAICSAFKQGGARLPNNKRQSLRKSQRIAERQMKAPQSVTRHAHDHGDKTAPRGKCLEVIFSEN